MNATFDELCKELSGMLRDLKRVTVSIDGMACAGKTTLAERLSSFFTNSEIIHMDDFYLPQEKRTEERIAQIGGHMDTERFTTEVAEPLRKALVPVYGIFDCHTQRITEQKMCAAGATLYIVEGTYAHHPEIPDIYDLRIFVETDEKTQAKRIEEREGENAAYFSTTWLPREKAYFEAYMVRELSDMVYRDLPINSEELLPYQPNREAGAN